MSRYVAEGYWVSGYAVGDYAEEEVRQGGGSGGHGSVIVQARRVEEKPPKKKKVKKKERQTHIALVPTAPEVKPIVLPKAPDSSQIERQERERQESTKRQKDLQAELEAAWREELDRRRQIKRLEKLIAEETERREKLERRRQEEQMIIDFVMNHL